MNKLSLKFKITLWYTAAMIVLSSIALFATLSVSHELLKRDASQRLIRTTEMTIHQLFTPDGRIKEFPNFRFYERGVHMAVYDTDANLISGQIPFGISEKPKFHNNELREISYSGEKYCIFDREIILFDNTKLWFRGVISMSNENYTIASIAKTNIILTGLLIILAAAGGYLIICKSFVPVKKISETAVKISKSSDLSQRINIGNGKDEITALANTFDDMLDTLEKTFEREKQFTSDASHELRTPIAVILSECEFMNDCAETVEDLKESALTVTNQAEKMSKLISELLTITRMDKNTFNLNFEDVDLSELLQFVCDEQVDIHDSSIALNTDIAPDIHINADRFLIARLLINLISNSYQYGKENGFINVGLKEDINHITLEVEDNGIGIEKENIDKIWERFYQEDPSRTSNQNGSMGLGLSMVKRITNAHNFKIECESEKGKRTKFTLVIPKQQNTVNNAL